MKCYIGGNEALNDMLDAPVKPNLILLDMVMPVMDGMAVLKMLKANPKTTSIPVIFMTAKKNEADIKKYMNMGALSVITKPIDIEDFPHQIALLSQFLDKP